MLFLSKYDVKLFWFVKLGKYRVNGLLSVCVCSIPLAVITRLTAAAAAEL